MSDTNIGFNTHLYNFKNNLVDTINKSGLPVGVVYYVMKDLFMDIQNAYENILKSENESMLNSIENEKATDEDSKKTKSSPKKTEK